MKRKVCEVLRGTTIRIRWKVCEGRDPASVHIKPMGLEEPLPTKREVDGRWRERAAGAALVLRRADGDAHPDGTGNDGGKPRTTLETVDSTFVIRTTNAGLACTYIEVLQDESPRPADYTREI